MSGKQEKPRQTETVQLAKGWSLQGLVDDDGHLNVYVTNSDGTDIIDVETGQGDGTDGDQLALRFTTQKIEDDDRRSR
jgi:hypothetical protein